jgi:hypothetical protein
MATMASTIFFQGKVIATPGSYSEVDASGLEQIGLGATGICALIGTAVGGKPVSTSLQTSEFIRLNTPEKVRRTFRSGDLREAGSMIFEPSSDADILAGAQEVVFMKTNQATQASRTFSNSNGTSLIVVSQDYGEFTNQISIQHQAGTNPGTKRMTVSFEDTTEAADNVGGSDIFTLRYTEPSALTGWDAVRAQILNSGVKINATRRETGLSAHVLAAITAGENVRVSSNNVGDTQQITVYGLDTGNNPVRETLQLNGTALIIGTQTWNTVWGASLSSPAIGTILVEEDAGAFPDLLSFAAAQSTRGLVLGSTMFVANAPLSLVADAPSTASILLYGRNAAGLAAAERVILTGTTYVRTLTSWSQIDVIVLGDLDSVAPRFLLIAGTAVQSLNTTQNTVKKLADLVNAKKVGADGFTLELVTGNLSFLVADVDLTADASPTTNADITLILPTGSDIKTAVLGFKANLKAMLDFYTSNSQLADATRIAFLPKIVDVTVTAFATVTVTIDGYNVSGTGGTIDATRDALIVAINNDHRVNQRVFAASNGAGIVRITAFTPAGFTFAEADANLTSANIQSTAGVGAPPDNTSLPEFLTGGSEGLSTFADFQNALNLLKKVRVNSIVVMTGDPAVHAALDAHCAFMGGLGRSERDGFVGLLNSGLTGVPNKTEAKSQIVDINSRHIRAFAQTITRFNTAGERTDFLPPFQAVIAAGMQAGAVVGTSLTHKFANVLDVKQDATWNPIDDTEEMIQAGLCFMERLDGVGRRWVRNVTTWLKSNNIAFIEGSVNQAVNFAVFEFRTTLETVVGKRGFAGTINAAKGAALNKLGLLIDSGSITTFRALTMELIVDVLEVSVEIAPIIPINFVKSTIHLVTIRQAAA